MEARKVQDSANVQSRLESIIFFGPLAYDGDVELLPMQFTHMQNAECFPLVQDAKYALPFVPTG